MYLGFSLFYWWSNISTFLFIHLLGFSWTWAIIALVIWLSEMRCTSLSNVAWGLFLPQPQSEWQCDAGTRPAQTKLSSFPVQSCPTAFLLRISAFRGSSFPLHTVLPWMSGEAELTRWPSPHPGFSFQHKVGHFGCEILLEMGKVGCGKNSTCYSAFGCPCPWAITCSSAHPGSKRGNTYSTSCRRAK